MNCSCITGSVSQVNFLRFGLRMYFTITVVLLKLIFLTQHRKSVAWHDLAHHEDHEGHGMSISCWARIAAGICCYSLLVVKEELICFPLFFHFVPPCIVWEMTIDGNLQPVNQGHHSGTGSSASRRDAPEASHKGVSLLPKESLAEHSCKRVCAFMRQCQAVDVVFLCRCHLLLFSWGS